MPLRPIGRCSSLVGRCRFLSSTHSPLHALETPSVPTPSERSRKLIDVSKIWQAQGNDGKLNPLESKSETAYDILEKCPDPECPCAATPAMPDGLPIDRTSKMSMPYYDRHVLIGARSKPGSDPHASALEWQSKIESDPEHPAAILKHHLGPKGNHYRPDFAVSITASTLSSPREPRSGEADADEFWLFPDFVRVQIPRRLADAPEPLGSPDSAEAGMVGLARAVSASEPLQQQHDTGRGWTRERITKPVILICGHGSRDQRCGILGPLLLSEFEKHVGVTGDAAATAHLGLVSHIGGHKFAGNVIIYMPPIEDQSRSGLSLNGKGVWYGRVEPRHVEGIVRETVERGRAIRELLRGIHDFPSIS